MNDWPAPPEDRFRALPSSLQKNARTTTLAGVPALVVHPDWTGRAPFVVWMHGRTAYKELDPGRYLRWMRAGIGAVALDLPGHGERYSTEYHHPRKTPDTLSQMLRELDPAIDELHDTFDDLFNDDRMGIGGMSAGGMVTLRRLCDPHNFKAAAVESTTGWLHRLYHPTDGADRWPVSHDDATVAAIDPMQNLDAWAPIPLLALHSEADQTVPLAGQRGFIQEVEQRHPGTTMLRTWPETGAPSEHAGFGKVAAEAKNIQLEFFKQHLL